MKELHIHFCTFGIDTSILTIDMFATRYSIKNEDITVTNKL